MLKGKIFPTLIPLFNDSITYDSWSNCAYLISYGKVLNQALKNLKNVTSGCGTGWVGMQVNLPGLASQFKQCVNSRFNERLS